jgi:hypothetical protein
MKALTSENIRYIVSLTSSNIREDLKIAKAMIVDGDYLDAAIATKKGSTDDGLIFTVGNTHVWQCRDYWQVADLVNNRYTNHRGWSPSLRETLDNLCIC